MENVMKTNSFQELNEVEVMETEGGAVLLCLVLAVGCGILLTGCNGNSDNSTESTQETGVGFGTVHLHAQAGCDDTTSCVLGENTCPYH